MDTDPNSRFLLKMRRSQTLVGPHIFLCSVRPANITSLGQRGKLESKIHDWWIKLGILTTMEKKPSKFAVNNQRQ